MTEDLAAKLAAMTESRPEPADPAAPVRQRIEQRRRRRRSTAAVLVAAAAVTVAAAAGPALDALRPGGPEAGVAGFAPPTTAAPMLPTPSVTPPQPSSPQTKVLPEPWSDKEFTTLPDANAYRPAYYVAQGRISTGNWSALSLSGACLVVEEGAGNSFGRPYRCYTEWPAGRSGDFTVTPGRVREKSATMIDATLVMGAVSVEARTVRIVAGGKTYTTDAVGTPTSDRLRFFALVVPHKNAKVDSMTPLDADGRPAPAPANPPTSVPCAGQCGTAGAPTPA
ncbi:hypothetical protein BWI15_02415 [Kribbella sp. ALI-6-A]|uniref:hypothetical protein n=1 Tax=Kribbella sp. ALI-6-A TaxID=1933817 RepID=UPI00097BD9D5|nr:hypothetical protein [Kribbella sp. ALI-6-A]ONI78347.1 hypothetical protein BWI15_02415 [Kribbella sp. ALI-6-A]